ncbi:MAG: hypothetical protein HQK52_16075 [Oligoflexia bacterium]|nr:hypothetical protein [Oligoflexia bacterium]
MWPWCFPSSVDKVKELPLPTYSAHRNPPVLALEKDKWSYQLLTDLQF